MWTVPLLVPDIRSDAVTARGRRLVNADAMAAERDPVSGRWAFAVADGIGDNLGAAKAARLAATVAARVASGADPVSGLLAAHQALLDTAPGDRDGDSVLVVAVPTENSCELAWVGDCRAYASNGRVLQQITVDHTVAEFYRSRGRRVTRSMEHQVTTTVRTAREDLIGRSRTGFGAGRLLLCTDGVHKPLPTDRLRNILDRPASPGRIARLLVDGALPLGGGDNATALVVAHNSTDTTWAAA